MLQVNIERFAVEQGLYGKDLRDIVQDQKGFIWVGTRNGFARFDGRKFKNYGPDRTGLQYWVFVRLKIDPEGNIWFFHQDKTVQFLKADTDQILSFDQFLAGKSPFRGEEIQQVFSNDARDSVFYFFLKDKRMFRFDGRFSEMKTPANLPGEPLHNFYCSPKSRLAFWISNHDFIVSDTLGNVLENGKLNIPMASVMELQDRSHIFFNSDGSAAYSKDIPEFSRRPADSPIESLVFFENGKPFQLPPVAAFSPEPDGSGTVSVQEHIYFFDSGRNLVRKIALPPTMSGRNPPNIHSVFKQNGGLYWASTNEGLYKICLSESKFKTFLPKQSLRGIAPLDENTLLINSYAGASVFYREEMITEPSDLMPPSGIDLTVLPDGNLLSGFEGMNLYKIDSKARKHSIFARLAESGNINTVFFDEKTGQVWAGSTGGLFKFDPTDGLLHRFNKHENLARSNIRYFFKNAEGLWVCSNTGLYLLDGGGNVASHWGLKSGLPNDDVNFLHEDAEGVFWLALRGGGLVRWDKRKGKNKTPEFEVFDQRHGFYNDFIYSILEDRFGFLWLPTNLGLIRFDKNSHQLRTFLTRDGLPEDEFNSFSHFQAPDGRIFLGGLNGLTVFQPADFINSPSNNAPLHITNLEVFDGDAEKLVNRTEESVASNKIELGAGDLFFELEFALLNYTEPGKNRYAYFIEGYESQWNYLSDNKVRIAGLPPGFYVLRARAQGSDGQWSPKEISMPIIVRYPIYMRWRFWFGIAIFLGLGFWLLTRLRTQQLLKRQQELKREVAARTEIISRQAEELRALDRAKSIFFENITHELRTPLTLILTPAEMLKGTLKTPANQQSLDIIRRNAEKMLDMVGQLLDMAKLESGAMLPQKYPGDAVQFSENLLENFRLQAEKGQIALRFSCIFSKIQTQTDFQLLDRALSNLLTNALKFTPPGGVVQLSLKKTDSTSPASSSHLVWKVSDTGKGIAAKDLPHVFERFFRGEDSTIETEGTGIGLSLALEIARSLGGNISVQSEEGVGSVFELHLPFEPAPFENLKMSPPEKPAKTESALKGKRSNAEGEMPPPEILNEGFSEKPLLLLVEDNPDLRQMLRAALSEKHEIQEAADGSEGMALALENAPDLVLADVMMPGMDGFEFAKMLKNDRRTSHVPLIFLTAKTAPESMMKGLELGADAYMTKPFRMEELLLRIEKLLEKSQNLRQLWASGKVLQNAPSAKTEKPLPETLPEAEAEFLKELQELILKNLDDPRLNGDFIGRKIGMSRMNLHRKLKTLTGESTSDFIRDIRFEQALQMLASGKFQIAEVAHRVGFSTPAHFSTVFKENFGVPPSEWLKNQP